MSKSHRITFVEGPFNDLKVKGAVEIVPGPGNALDLSVMSNNIVVKLQLANSDGMTLLRALAEVLGYNVTAVDFHRDR